MKPLERRDLAPDPIEQFNVWFREVRRSKRIPVPEALCLSTVGKNGEPEGRMVLMKECGPRGFVFYTHLGSPKARALMARPRASLTFYWDPPGRQVRVTGRTRLVSHAEADAYFATRPRMSQIGAWASPQSATLSSRSVLESRVAQFVKRFRGKKIPRPKNWTGFRLTPAKIEFWQRRKYRLNDRFLYAKRASGWSLRRLYP
jgi:pyridoxamine 5'-phosphate oxidase